MLTTGPSGWPSAWAYWTAFALASATARARAVASSPLVSLRLSDMPSTVTALPPACTAAWICSPAAAMLLSVAVSDSPGPVEPVGLLRAGAVRGRRDRPDFADQGDPVQDALHVEVAEVLRAEVGGRPVVPEGDAARRPAEPHRVLGPGDLVEEVAEDETALDGRHVEDVVGEDRVHEQRLLPGPGVDPDDRVVGDEGVLREALRVGRLARPGQPGPVRAVPVLRAQRVHEPLDRLRTGPRRRRPGW